MYVLNLVMKILITEKAISPQYLFSFLSLGHEKNFRHRVKRKMAHCYAMSKKKKKNCKLNAIVSLLVRLKIRKVSFDNVDGCPDELKKDIPWDKF